MDRRVEKIERKGSYGMKEKIRAVFDTDTLVEEAISKTLFEVFTKQLIMDSC
ncbi:hypothetical protein [Peribacillus loiseleuriae]|uniref:hypothetical protein n=1 Tax=Peribacillus loiseleuriae TaxID=1679170 RepID=UPI0012E1497F|nr:hypothetical protein [Peribacillus loiseleuriae]